MKLWQIACVAILFLGVEGRRDGKVKDEAKEHGADVKSIEAASASPTGNLRRSRKQADKRLLTEELEEETTQLGPIRAAISSIVNPDGPPNVPVIGQVAATVANTGRDLIGTAVQGNKLLHQDATKVLEQTAVPLYQSLQSDARRIAGTGRNIINTSAEVVGYNALKQDTRKILLAAAEAVRKGEQSLAGTFKGILPPAMQPTTPAPAAEAA